MVAADLFRFIGKENLITANYCYSKSLEVDWLSRTDAAILMGKLKQHSEKHEFPQVLQTDRRFWQLSLNVLAHTG